MLWVGSTSSPDTTIISTTRLPDWTWLDAAARSLRHLWCRVLRTVQRCATAAMSSSAAVVVASGRARRARGHHHPNNMRHVCCHTNSPAKQQHPYYCQKVSAVCTVARHVETDREVSSVQQLQHLLILSAEHVLLCKSLTRSGSSVPGHGQHRFFIDRQATYTYSQCCISRIRSDCIDVSHTQFAAAVINSFKQIDNFLITMSTISCSYSEQLNLTISHFLQHRQPLLN